MQIFLFIKLVIITTHYETKVLYILTWSREIMLSMNTHSALFLIIAFCKWTMITYIVYKFPNTFSYFFYFGLVCMSAIHSSKFTTIIRKYKRVYVLQLSIFFILVSYCYTIDLCSLVDYILSCLNRLWEPSRK